MATVFRAPTYASNQRAPQSGGWTGAAVLLTTLAVVAAPFNNSGAYTAPQARQAVQADTSKGIPKPLYADAKTPFFVPPHFASVIPGQKGKWGGGQLNADTSRGTPKTLYADSVAPFFVPAHFSPVVPAKKGQLNADTSKSTAKQLYADSVAPFLNPAQPVLDRPRPVADTTQDTPLTLLISQPAPFAQQPILAVEAKRDLRDTSQSTPLALFPAGAPPFVSPLSIQVDRRLDTRLDVPANLAIQTPGIQPFAQYDWPAPIEYRVWFESKTDQQAQPDTIPPPVAEPPAPPPAAGGEYGREKRKKRFKVGAQVFTDQAQALNALLPPEAEPAEPVKFEAKADEHVELIKAVVAALPKVDVAAIDWSALDEEDIEMLLLSL